MSVVERVQADLDELRDRDPKLADSGLAATALALAAGIDDPNSLTSKSMAARELRELLLLLKNLAPAAADKDDLDDLRTRRTARLAGRSRTAH